MTDKTQDCYYSIEKLFEKYKDNDYIQQRIYNHIVTYLPNTLENESKNYEKRQNLNISLTQEQQIFIQIFLSKNNYYYLNSNNFYYKYDRTNYFIIKEDEIIHKLLSTISNERLLLQWKHKTKLNILKQIKDRNLFTSIPETDTIQNVINSLVPLIFATKNAAKYFLTIIGDNILKKNTQLIFLVNSHIKQFLNELNDTSIICINHSNVTNNFMTKYHENHLYENCRIIKVNNFSNEYWRDMLKKIGLNLLCVAVYYSNRYENSDKFIDLKADEDLRNYTYYLKNNNQENIVNNFCDKFIINTDNNLDNKLEWKNIHFIWKQFLTDYNLPNIMYSNNLKNILKDKYKYDENTELFYGITSKYLPVYKEFIDFWNSTIKINQDNDTINNNELEIDELCLLFKLKTKQNISEEIVVKILTHFFPQIEIIDNKFILNISSNMWNKCEAINSSFNFVKDKIIILNKNNNLTLISIDDLYDYYKECCNINSIRLIVSKRYFENYIYYKLSEFIIYDKFIKIDWIY